MSIYSLFFFIKLVSVTAYRSWDSRVRVYGNKLNNINLKSVINYTNNDAYKK